MVLQDVLSECCRSRFPQYTLLRPVLAGHTDAAGTSGDAVSYARPPFRRYRVECKRSLHDQVQTAIRPDQQCKIRVLAAAVSAGDVEQLLRVFEKWIHSKLLSAAQEEL